MAVACKRVIISGRVQGVSFRRWTEREAMVRGLSGWVRNRQDGTVEAVFCGNADAVEAMIAACRQGPRLARVNEIQAFPHEETLAEGAFRTRETC